MSPRSQNDAKVWVEKAIAFYKASGKRIALAEFTNPTGPFVGDELYVFVLSDKGTMLAHGINEKYVGEEFIDIKDADSKHFIKEILDAANTKGSGWVTYKWYHPITRKVLPKNVYCQKFDGLIFCSGIYVHETSLRETGQRAKITVHLGTCGIAAGARTVMDALMSEIAEAAATDIMVATSGCAGMCKEEPMVTIEILGEEPIVYGQMDASRIRQVFKRHVLEGEVQTVFAIPKA